MRSTPPDLRPEIMAYYRRGGERTRLDAGPGRLEYLRTWDVLTRVLPAAPATVLDVGGGTGVYAEPLAEAGYRVHLIDPVPDHVAAASARAGVTAEVGDVRALPAADASADAVLLLGPLYHLLDRAERITAWREATRVVRPGGVVVAATINRFAGLLEGLVKDLYARPGFADLIDRAVADGVQDMSAGAPFFTSAYFHRPEELPGEVTEAGLARPRRYAVEGPMWLSGARLDEILASDEQTAEMLARLRQVEEEPSLLGASAHLLTVACRPDQGSGLPEL